MKLVVVLLLLSIQCLAQKNEIPKASPGITFTVSPTDSSLFNLTIELLNSKDYVVDKADKKFGTIVTQGKAVKGTLVNMRVLVTIKNNFAVFKGQWSGSAMGYTFTNEPVSYKGSDKKLFLILSNLVSALRDSVDKSTIGYLPAPN